MNSDLNSLFLELKRHLQTVWIFRVIGKVLLFHLLSLMLLQFCLNALTSGL